MKVEEASFKARVKEIDSFMPKGIKVGRKVICYPASCNRVEIDYGKKFRRQTFGENAFKVFFKRLLKRKRKRK